MKKWWWIALMAVACQSPEKMYQTEKSALMAQVPAIKQGVYDSATIATLPPTLQKYLLATGYMGRPIQLQAQVKWEQAWLKVGFGSEWGEMKMQQFNSAMPLGRLAHMEFLDMPLSGRDKYFDGEGEMKGKLFGLFPVITGEGGAVTQSALITAFAEFMLMPACMLQPYVSWEEIKAGQVRGTLKHDRFTVQGDFYFDEKGLFKRFETQDRFYDLGQNKYKKLPFFVYVDAWKSHNGLQIPSSMRALWQLPEEGAFEYFRGRLAGIDYLP